MTEKIKTAGDLRPTVINVKDGDPEKMIRIHHPSRWTNPYKVDSDGTLKEVLYKYRDFLRTKPGLLREIRDGALDGKQLGCHCAPDKACHGHILMYVWEAVRLPILEAEATA